MLSSIFLSATLLASSAFALQEYGLVSSHSGDSEYHLRPIYVGADNGLTFESGEPCNVSITPENRLVVYTSSVPEGQYFAVLPDNSVAPGDEHNSTTTRFNFYYQRSNSVLEWGPDELSTFYGCPGDLTNRVYAGYPRSLCTDPHYVELVAFPYKETTTTTSTPLSGPTSA